VLKLNIRTFFKVYYRTILGGPEKDHEEQPVWSVSGPRFKPGTSRIRNGNANHCTAMFGTSFVLVVADRRIWFLLSFAAPVVLYFCSSLS
jgi:hypothetical protein